MECREAQRILSETQDLENLGEACREHVGTCRACRTLRDQLLAVDGLVKENSPELPQDFELSLRRRLKESQKTPAGSRRWWIAAAAVLLIGSSVLLARRGLVGQPSFHKLMLSITASQPLEAVHFDLRLPDGVRLAPGAGTLLGHGNHLAWVSNIEPGVSEFELPLLLRVRSARVQAEVKSQGRTIKQTIELGRDKNAHRGHGRDAVVSIAWQRDRFGGGR